VTGSGELVPQRTVTQGLAEAAQPLESPPILAGHVTPEVRTRVEGFYRAIECIFESWVNRSESHHTRRAYRDDILSFVRFLGLAWSEAAGRLLQVSVLDVQRFREALLELGAANKTLNRRICSLSSFYKYLGLSAAELRLPIVAPNPASAQLVRRAKPNPRRETKALSLARVRQLLSLPLGHDATALRDRAILHFYLYSGARIAAGCKLEVADFHYDREDADRGIALRGSRSDPRVHRAGEHHGGAAVPAIRALALKASGERRYGRVHHVSPTDELPRSTAGSFGGCERPAGQGSAEVHLQSSFPPGILRDAPARCRRRHPRSAGAARAQAHYDNTNLRQAPALDARKRFP
jgi:integrase